MRAAIVLLFGTAVCVLFWFAMVVVHDYGQSKYVQGYSEAMENCAAGRVK
jgi:hypothetical protein